MFCNLILLNELPINCFPSAHLVSPLSSCRCSREGIRLCGRLHCEQRRPSGHGALLRSGLHLHHRSATDGPGWSPGVCAGPEEPRGPGAPQGPPEERQTHEAAAHGQWPACGQLPQPHHPHTGMRMWHCCCLRYCIIWLCYLYSSPDEGFFKVKAILAYKIKLFI